MQDVGFVGQSSQERIPHCGVTPRRRIRARDQGLHLIDSGSRPLPTRDRLIDLVP